MEMKMKTKERRTEKKTSTRRCGGDDGRDGRRTSACAQVDGRTFTPWPWAGWMGWGICGKAQGQASIVEKQPVDQTAADEATAGGDPQPSAESRKR